MHIKTPEKVTPAHIKQNLKHIHITTVTTYINNRKNNKLLHTAALTINTAEATLTKANVAP